MERNNSFLRYTWFILVMVFVVILAGGVVRMTQSGMGCPDWPKCFGRWIPPTSASQLPPDFEKYLKQQDIDHTFNVYHTWVEYINRLLGALLGIFIFIHTCWSFIRYRKTNGTIVFLSVVMLLAVGFQGWLGKKVVDANLEVVKVTIHMMVALFIAALPLLIISQIKQNRVLTNKMLKGLVVITLLLVLMQIVLGTAVREQTDEIAAALNYTQRNIWIKRMGDEFLIHRSFSWIVAAACVFLFWNTYIVPEFRAHAFAVLVLMLVAFALGLTLYFMKMPALAQPLHLLFASLLAISLFSFRLKMK
ncbi:MAG TPA: COX15/CtaA family protein [Chitinophagaceae bacterium]|nr:COX15/CtaA family protein [Chitinophagaceae bacterium]